VRMMMLSLSGSDRLDVSHINHVRNLGAADFGISPSSRETNRRCGFRFHLTWAKAKNSWGLAAHLERANRTRLHSILSGGDGRSFAVAGDDYCPSP